MKNFNEIIGNRTRDLPDCSAVPQKKNYAITHTGALMGREVFLENVD